jgi:CelD/BcsL family acetyltransferase involved in cellulose biosynthesis
MIGAPSEQLRRCSIIDPTVDPRWDHFAETHPAASIFHTAAWARVLVDAYGYQPRYHVLERADGAIEAAWPTMLVSSRLTGRRLVSLPFCDHCAPLVHSREEADTLLGAVLADQRHTGASRVEVRGWLTDALGLPRILHPIHYFGLYEMNLFSTPQQLFLRMNTTARRYVRQAERKGVRARLSTSRTDLEYLYNVNLLLRRRHGMLPQPFAFFEAIHRHLMLTGLGHILIAEVENRPVAAFLCLTFGETAMCKFSVSEPQFWDYRPNHFLLWKTLEWACEQGFHVYDYGRCGANDSGLAQFKEQCGFIRRDLPYFYFPLPGGFSVAEPDGIQKKLLRAFAQVAPKRMFEFAGSHLYGHLG